MEALLAFLAEEDKEADEDEADVPAVIAAE
jgi:hypothetical protein